MKWNYKTIKSVHAGSFKDELSQCVNELENFIKDKNTSLTIARLNIFIETNGLEDFISRKMEVEDAFNSLSEVSFIYEVLPQKPFGRKVAMKAMYMVPGGHKVSQQAWENGNLKTAKLTIGDSAVFLSTISAYSRNIEDDSTSCFEETEQFLKNHGMCFGNVARQWNFIGGIVEETHEGEGTTQNYQEFNDVRSAYYNKSNFENGYPSATGIGMDIEGVAVQTVTYDSRSIITIPINNPDQKPAHQYSKEVLVGSTCLCQKTTPKFERAKAVLTDRAGWIFVSGTAAIKGELHQEEQGIEAQTAETLELIKNLVSEGNLENHSIQMKGKQLKPETFRAYVKKEEDAPYVENACKAFFGNVPGLVFIADICRCALLVEIECEYQLV